MAQWVILGVSIGVIALALVAAFVIFFWPGGSSSPQTDSTADGDQTPVTDEALAQTYDYDLTKQPNVPSDQTFLFPMVETFNFDSCAATTCWDFFQVYADAALTRELDFTAQLHWNESFNRPDGVVVGPPEYGINASAPCHVSSNGTCSGGEDASEELGEQGHWALSNKYYLVRRVDEWGKRLDRPQVTLFTVRDAAPLAEPGVDASVADDGSVDFRWPRIEGATSYSVVMVTRPRERKTAGKAGVQYTIIGKTDSTSLNSAAASGERKHIQTNETSGVAPTEQNANITEALVHWTYSGGKTDFRTEDQMFKSEAELGAAEHEAYIPADNGFPIVTFGVIAHGASGSSGLREIDGDALMAQIPVSVAEFGQQQYEEQHPCGDPDDMRDFGCLDARMVLPVTMADGRTSQRPMITDASHAQPCGAVIYSGGRKDTRPCTRAISRAQGTAFFDYLQFQTAALGQAELDTIAAQNDANMEAMPRAGGGGAAFSYAAPTDLQIDPDERIATTMPEVPYPVNGSIELVKYIAANVMAGNLRMDVTRYVQDPSVDLDDAAAEALDQNPYALGVSNLWARTEQIGDRTILRFSPDAPDLTDEFPAVRDQMMKKASSVIDSIITPGMSDTDKAKAINRWLINNGEYDDDAYKFSKQVDAGKATNEDLLKKYPHDWNAAGILLDGRGVCVSYAAAFKLLADQADLPAVYVTGVATDSSEGHAWVKARLNGKWRVIDPTWNDNGDPERYFGQTDKKANGDRAEDTNWMMDPFIKSYAAK